MANAHPRIAQVPALGKLSKIQWINGSVWRTLTDATPKRHAAVSEQDWLTLCRVHVAMVRLYVVARALKRILLFILLTVLFSAHFRRVEYISIPWQFSKNCSKSGQWSGFQLIVESNLFLLWFCSATLCDWLEKLAPLFPPMTSRNQPCLTLTRFPALGAGCMSYFRILSIALFPSVVIGQIWLYVTQFKPALTTTE